MKVSRVANYIITTGLAATLTIGFTTKICAVFIGVPSIALAFSRLVLTLADAAHGKFDTINNIAFGALFSILLITRCNSPSIFLAIHGPQDSDLRSATTNNLIHDDNGEPFRSFTMRRTTMFSRPDYEPPVMLWSVTGKPPHLLSQYSSITRIDDRWYFAR